VKILIYLVFLLASVVVQAEQDPFIHQGVYISQDNQGVSLQCESISLGVVLQTLAEQLHLNLLLTVPLEQPVSMNIRGVSKQQLLASLLLAYHLNTEVRDNITVIMPNQTTQSPQDAKIFMLKYANAQALAESLQSRLQASFDSRTNALIVYNLEGEGEWLNTLIAQIDVPVKQVYIEALIMNASTAFSKELGLRFHLDTFSVARLPDDISLEVTLAAAQENHQTNVIAHPKLLTVNLQEAHIKQGKQLAYQETAPNGATSVSFQEATLELKVTPMITPEHDIVLNLLVKQDMIGHLVFNGQPTIDTKSVQAQVRVKDGETIVLGGIYSQVDKATRWQVPGLGQLPLIGALFRDYRQKDDKDELLIFVTPHVVV
jgi:type IV pilus assembly protein PilQ